MASDEKNRQLSSLPTRGYTLEVRLTEQLVVIIGGGLVGRRKIPALLRAGAKVHVIDPAPLTELPIDPELTHSQRKYLATDLTTARLVFAATNDPVVNQQVAKDAQRLGILYCRTDNFLDSDFITPAQLSLPPLSFSVSSGGQSPALVAILRNLLAEIIPECWPTAIELAALIRRKVLTEQPQIPYNQQVFLALVAEGLFVAIEQADSVKIDQLLLKHFGDGFSLQELQFKLPEGTP